MKRSFSYLLIVVLVFSSCLLKGQMLNRANKYFNSFSYQDAIELYQQLWQKDSLNDYITRQLAISYRKINNSEMSEKWYARVVCKSDVLNEDYLHYAQALQSNEKYDQARLWMDKYWNMQSNGEKMIIDPLYLQGLKKDSILFQVNPLSVNSEESDFGITYYRGGVVFSSSRVKTALVKRKFKWNDQDYLRLYEGNIEENGDVTTAEIFSRKLGTNYHDGPVCFNQEGNEMFLTRNYVSPSKRAQRNKKGVVSIKLYYSKKENDRWSDPMLMPFNMNGVSSGHPTLSKDGMRLYFISDRPGGFGGTDLYVCKRNKTGWDEPVNLGADINTFEDEMFPFISEDNVLYFSSKGHPGFGGLDLFYVDCSKKNIQPGNMGYPINSSKDDFGLIKREGTGYFSSNRKKGESFDDLYRFKILKRKIEGKVLDSETGEAIEGSLVLLVDENGDVQNKMTTNKDGSFSFYLSEKLNCYLIAQNDKYIDGKIEIADSEIQKSPTLYRSIFLDPIKDLNLEGVFVNREDDTPVVDVNVSIKQIGGDWSVELISDDKGLFSCYVDRDYKYLMAYHKEGIIAKTVAFDTFNVEGDTIRFLEKIDRIQVGKVFVLNNIFYDLNKADIRADAAVELDKLVKIMNDNPGISIELRSHTDARGSDAYNLKLSQQRAHMAARYLISKGVQEKRIVAKGYGETQLINHCANGVKCSDMMHQQNRRTEFKITKID